MSILKWDQRTCVRSRQNRKCRSKPLRATLATNFLRKSRSAGAVARLFSATTPTIAAEEENFFEALLPDKLSKLTALAVKPLRAMPVAVQRRMLHVWLRASDVPDLGFDLIERVRALLDPTNRLAKTNLPRDRHVR